MRIWWGSDFTCAKAAKVFFVCLSVTLLNVRVCGHDFAMKALQHRNDFETLG